MSKHKTEYQLLTYYKFVDIEKPKEEVDDHRQFCVDVGLRGRIYIGEEGINGTITGNIGQLKAYRLYLKSNPYYESIPDIDEKATPVDGHKFKKMIVRYRKEIVALGEIYRANDIVKSMHSMNSEQFKEILDSEDDSWVILDMRNIYEYRLGHFKNAIPAGTVQFRELKDTLELYKQKFADKKIAMYCTGGIRCEKAGVLLEKSGLEGVYQLDGGVVKYVNKYNDGNWEGNLYTFDDRISTYVGDEETHTIIGECHFTGEKAENFYNCRYGPCNRQYIAIEKEYRKYKGFCSEECYNSAFNDLLVRNWKYDNYNYKELRGRIKNKPELKEEISAFIRIEICKGMDDVIFNHKKPVDEPSLHELLNEI